MGVPERYSYQFRQYIFILITRLLKYALHYRGSGELLMNHTKQYLRFEISLSIDFQLILLWDPFHLSPSLFSAFRAKTMTKYSIRAFTDISL